MRYRVSFVGFFGIFGFFGHGQRGLVFGFFLRARHLVKGRAAKVGDFDAVVGRDEQVLRLVLSWCWGYLGSTTRSLTFCVF